jgi:hypothetical protein
MKEKLFIFRPLFFIFNLVFATWLVFKIEKISPSDFGKYRTLFDTPEALTPEKMGDKLYLKKICSDYKGGKLDSTEMEQLLDRYLTASKSISAK